MIALLMAFALVSSAPDGDGRALKAWTVASERLAAELRHGEWCRPPGSVSLGECRIRIPGLELEWVKGKHGWIEIKKLDSAEISLSMLNESRCLSIRRQPRKGGTTANALLEIETGEILLMSASARCEKPPPNQRL